MLKLSTSSKDQNSREQGSLPDPTGSGESLSLFTRTNIISGFYLYKAPSKIGVLYVYTSETLII